MCVRLFFNGRCSLFIKIRSEEQNPCRIQTELKLNRRKEILGPFTLRKNWVHTRQEKSTDLTFLPVDLGMGKDPCFFRFWGHRHLWPQNQKKTGPDQFLDSYLSLRNNFANGMRSILDSH